MDTDDSSAQGESIDSKTIAYKEISLVKFYKIFCTAR